MRTKKRMLTSQRITSLVLSLAGALAFTASSADRNLGREQQSSIVPQIDACSLLSPADIATALTVAVNDGMRSDTGLEATGAYSSTCMWMINRSEPTMPGDENEKGRPSFVIVNAMQWPLRSGDARKFLQAFHDAAKQGDIPHQPSARNFGDEALWWGDGLAVRVRDVSFGISVFMPSENSKPRGLAEEQLAPTILARLADREASLGENSSAERSQ